MSDEPDEVYIASTSASLAQYQSTHATSIRDTAAYWSDLATSKLEWFAPYPPGSVLTGNFLDGSVSWFAGGKLNVCYNAVDRYCLAPYNRGQETAIIWEGDEPNNVKHITYLELQNNVCRIANALKAIGVQKGDVVTLYMPMVPELAMTMLACARIGAVHSVIFAGFSADAIADRIQDAKSKWVVTASVGARGGRSLPLKSICDAAIKKNQCLGIVEKVLVFDGHGANGSDWVQEADVDMNVHVKFTELVECQRPVCSCEWMDAEDPLFILYTSGSTGRPKGESASFLVYRSAAMFMIAKHCINIILFLPSFRFGAYDWGVCTLCNAYHRHVIWIDPTNWTIESQCPAQGCVCVCCRRRMDYGTYLYCEQSKIRSISHHTVLLLEFLHGLADSLTIYLLLSFLFLGLRATPQWYFDFHVRVDAHVSRLWSILGYGPAS